MDDAVAEILRRIEKLGRLEEQAQRQVAALTKMVCACDAEQLAELALQVRHQIEEVEHPDCVLDRYHHYYRVVRGMVREHRDRQVRAPTQLPNAAG